MCLVAFNYNYYHFIPIVITKAKLMKENTLIGKVAEQLLASHFVI